MSENTGFENYARHQGFTDGALSKNEDGSYVFSSAVLWNRIWQAAVEHCKQGEPYGYVSGSTYSATDAGTIRKTPNDVFNTPLFTHAMPKSEDIRLVNRLRSAITLFEKNLQEKLDAFRKGDYSNAAFPLTGESAKAYCYAHNSAIQWVLEQLPQLSEINSISPSTPQPSTDVSELVRALKDADEMIGIEPFEHVAQEAAESHENIRALIAKHTVNADYENKAST